MQALVALLAVTAIWGVTFVQVKDAVELYPLFAFLAVRFAIATVTLAGPAAARVRTLGRNGWASGALLGLLLAVGYVLQTAGLQRTTVSSTGFVTGMYVVLTPLIALLLFRSRIGLRYDALAFTLVEMLAACLGLAVVALALGDLSVPRGWTVWGALLVTGVFASALAFLVQTWAQRRTSATRTALAFTMEPVFTALFGYTLADDRLGALGWGGCAVIMTGILLTEPAAAGALVRATSASTRRSPR